MSAEYSTTIHRVHFFVSGLTRHLESIRHALLKIDFGIHGIDNPFDEVQFLKTIRCRERKSNTIIFYAYLVFTR